MILTPDGPPTVASSIGLRSWHRDDPSTESGVFSRGTRHGGKICVVNQRDLSRASKSLRLIVEKTSAMPGDSLRDSVLRDRLDLAAVVLETAVAAK
jgi:hypothetical protein